MSIQIENNNTTLIHSLLCILLIFITTLVGIIVISIIHLSRIISNIQWLFFLYIYSCLYYLLYIVIRLHLDVILRLLFIFLFVIVIEIIVIILILTLFGRLPFPVTFITLLICVVSKTSAHDLLELLLSPNQFSLIYLCV